MLKSDIVGVMTMYTGVTFVPGHSVCVSVCVCLCEAYWYQW